MKILIITDAWFPQVNGVVTTYSNIISQLSKRNIEVEVLHPGKFYSLPLFFYNEIKAAINPWKVIQKIKKSDADYIHIGTEGPLGIVSRIYLSYKKIPFTSAVHTKFPEYLNLHIKVPLSITYALMRWFHKRSHSVLVNTKSHKEELEKRGFRNLSIWSRGIDFKKFKDTSIKLNHKDYLLYVGRVSKEKNIEAFLNIETTHEKVVVGDGPYRQTLQKKFPRVKFVGCKTGPELAAWYRNASVFVFPSMTDTFGIVVIEALFCGVPVAAYPVTGPLDIVEEGITGSLDHDLKKAIDKALQINRENCTKNAEKYTWRNVAKQFISSLASIKSAGSAEDNLKSFS
jgi:glycosyltransferase involved in cell wall biosynthesis